MGRLALGHVDEPGHHGIRARPGLEVKPMAYLIASSCVGNCTPSCRDSEGGFPCVESCPVDGIFGRPGDSQLFVNADECIDCGDCYVECPASAIFPDIDLPAPLRAINMSGYQRAVEA
jgi:Fe-S-cluster-containing hydrogenase component 2